MKRWIRTLFSSKPQTIVRRSGTSLSFLNLEDRITPTDFRDVNGLRFFLPGLSDVYNNSASASSTNSFVQVGLTPGFGQTFTPLLDLPGGVFLSSSPSRALINTSLSVRGLTFTGSNLAFAFDQPNGKFSVNGQASVAVGGATINTTFGNPGATNPGLVIQNGRVASVDVSVTSQFALGRVSFATNDLRLTLDNTSTSSTRYTVTGAATATVQGTSSPITLTAQLGVPATDTTSAKPGLVVVNGSLTELTAGISGGFTVAGVSLNAKDLTFSMNPSTRNYSIFGSAGMSFLNSFTSINVDVLLGTAAQPGVSIVNGRLNSLNLGVTSDFSVGGLNINTKALTVTLDVPRNTFTLTGSAGFAFTGAGVAKVDLDVSFGANGTPGLRIVNGRLTELSVGVTSNFSLAGLSIEVNDVRFTYNRFFNRYGLSGGVFVSTAPVPSGRRVLDRLGVQLGSSFAPGIVVTNGRLERLDIALFGGLNLGSFSVVSPVPGRTDPLRVQFTRETGILQFTGGLEVSLSSKFTANAELTNGGLTINTTTGAVNLNGLRLGMVDTRLGPVFIRQAFIEFRLNADNSVDFSAGATVDLPAGLTVDGSFDVVNSRLRRIMLTVSKDPGVPLGNTGVFVSRLSGEINNIDTPDRLQVTGSVTLTAGPSYRIGGQSVSLIQGTVTLNIDLNPIERIIPGFSDAAVVRLTGAITLLGDKIPVNSGGISIFFGKNNGRLIQVQAFATTNFFNGFIRGTIFFDLNVAQRSIIITADLALRIPEFTFPATGPFPEIKLGGQELATAKVTLSLFSDNPLNSSLVFTAAVGLEGARLVEVTASINFRGEFSASGKLIGIPLGPVTAKFPALFTDPADADPARATRIRILSVEPVPNSPTKDLKVTFSASTAGALRDAELNFLVSEQRDLPDAFIPSLLTPRSGQTFNSSTGIGTTIIRNPEAFAVPGKPFTLTATLIDKTRTLQADSAPFGPIAGISAPVVNPAPTLTIQSVERVAGSTTNDLRVTFRATTTGNLRNVTASFSVADSTEILGFINLGDLDANQTYNASTGVGTTILTNPDRFTVPDRRYTIRGVIQDNFGTSTTPAFGSILPLAGPPTILGRTTLTIPTIGVATTVPADSFVINDPAGRLDPNARVLVSLLTDSNVILTLPTTGLPPTVEILLNARRQVVLTGTAGDINIMLDRLTITRRFDHAAYTINVLVERDGVIFSSVRRDVTITENAVLSLNTPSSAPSTVNAFGPAIRPFTGSTIQLFPGSQMRRVGIKIVTGTGANARPPFPGDVLDVVLPDTSPVFAFFDRGSFELIIVGDGTETVADLQRAIQSVTYSTVNSSGRVNLQVNLTDSRRQNFTAEKTILIQNPGIRAGLSASSGSLLAAATTTAQVFVDVGRTQGLYRGNAPVTIAANLRLSNSNASDRIAAATVTFSGLYDSTADTLTFTPANGITGTFDRARGVLSLKAGPSTTLAQFRDALRSVQYRTTRKNPVAYPREIQFEVTTNSGATSPLAFGRTLLAVSVPTVPTGITGSTSNLVFPPNGSPITLFPNVNLIYPDAALPAPSVSIGTFIPGSVLTRASVTLTGNYIRGEDFLTFTNVGSIRGTFYPDTGEVLFEGTGTLAQYTQALRSVKYQNRNTSPSTADRTFVITVDDGSASDNPATLSRIVKPQSDGRDTVRTSGSLNTLVVAPTAGEASLRLTNLNYAPRPGETRLVYTILETPRFTKGSVRLADGTIAEVGMEVTIEQLRGATFVLSDTPRAGTVPFSFSISGVNPVTRELTETPITATVPIRTTNVAPRVIAETFRTQANRPVTLDPLSNDVDLNTDVLVVDSFTQGANGKVVQNDDGTFTYTPRAGFSGTDRFSYTIEDGVGAQATGTTNITVAAPAPTLPAPELIGFREFAVGSDFGDANTATLFSADGKTIYTVNPFEASFTGGVRTAAADFNNDGIAELVVGTGPGRATQVRVLDGKTKAELFSIDPFEAAFQGGVFVTAGDISGDGVPDLVITPDEGGGPRVRIFSGKGFNQLADFFGIDDDAFRGGARAAVSDITGDDVGDLIVSAGFGGGPRVAVFDGTSLANGELTNKPFGDFFAFEPELRNGAFVTGGDINGDGFSELIAGGGPGGGPRVTAFSGKDLLDNTQKVLANFFGGDVETRGGIRVAVKNLDNDNRADLIVGAGAGAGSRATAYLGKNIQPNGTPETVLDFNAFEGFPGGIFVG